MKIYRPRLSGQKIQPSLRDLFKSRQIPGVETPGYCQSPLRGSGQNVGLNAIRADRAGWRLANFSNCVFAAGWTRRDIALRVKLDEGFDIVFRNERSIGFAFSRAHSFLAASIWRRILMQALAGLERGLGAFGIDAQAKNPIKAIITIQTRIYDLDDDLLSDSPIR